jgi:glycosyltransferase involved in cell wall biosynthesis
MTIRYSSLIRTFNSERTLPATLCSLAKQTIPPGEYIFVDSGSTDRTLSILPQSAILHEYRGREFNFSDALNQGLNYVSTEYVLIISSHTLLNDPGAMDYALNLLASNDMIGAAYFSNDLGARISHSLINKTIFDGFNGLWNTCALIKVKLLRRRPFRPDVFSAEDQEWARWLLHCENKVIARISGAGMDDSRNVNAIRHKRRKKINEYVAIAYFANRNLLSVCNLVRMAYHVIKPSRHIGLEERVFKLTLLFPLLACYFVKPKHKSKYF